MLITANIRAEIQTKSPSDDRQKIYWAWSQKAFILIQQLEGHLQVIYFNSLMLLIHSVRKYLSRPYYVSGTVLGTREKMSWSDSEHKANKVQKVQASWRHFWYIQILFSFFIRIFHSKVCDIICFWKIIQEKGKTSVEMNNYSINITWVFFFCFYT